MILFTGALAGTFYFAFDLGKHFGGNCKAPDIVCGDNSPRTSGWYNSNATFNLYGVETTYRNTINFEVTSENNFLNDTTLIVGHMYYCGKVDGFKATEYCNSTISYLYDTSTCAFHYATGSGYEYNEKNNFDERINFIRWNAVENTMAIGTSSHGPTGTMFNFTWSETEQFATCPPANDTAPFTHITFQ